MAAALKLDRSTIGIELKAEYCEYVVDRINRLSFVADEIVVVPPMETD